MSEPPYMPSGGASPATTMAATAIVVTSLFVTAVYSLRLRHRRCRLSRRNVREIWLLAGECPKLTSVLPTAMGGDDIDDNNNNYDDEEDDDKDNATNPRILTTVTRATTISDVDRRHGSSGMPTVVFLHGFGCTALEFGELARRTSAELGIDAVTIDRIILTTAAATNDGDSFEMPRTATVLAREVLTVLSRRGVRPPYLLVGHSYGGLVARVIAEEMTYADGTIVYGLVLLDPAHEGQFDAGMFPWDFSIGMHLSPYLFRIYRHVMAPLGLLHLMDEIDKFIFPPIHLIRCRETRLAARRLYSDNPIVWSHVVDEWQGCLLTFEQRRRKRPKTKDRPLPPGVLVIANQRRYSPTLYPDMITQAFLRLHRPLLDENEDTWQLVMANDSDHWIHLQQPQLVIDSIRTVIERSSRTPNY